jgi:hypothetical protein
LTTVIALMKHQALKMMANRRLSLSQKRIGHWMGKVAVGHRLNPGDSGSVCPTECSISELR